MPKAPNTGFIFPLDGDVLYQVFVHLTSFPALRTALLIARSFYAIYNAHPNSIKRAVAENVIGPILDEALDFIRSQYSEEIPKSRPKLQVLDYLKRWRIGRSSKRLIPVENPDARPLVLTHVEVRELSKLAMVMEGLEDLFSWRFKDKTTRTSQLSSIECLRFRRALLRIVVCSTKGDGLRHLDTDPFKSLSTRITYLETFSLKELVEIEDVVLFLNHILQWTQRATGPAWIDPPSPGYIPMFTTDTGSLSGRPLFDPDKILQDYRAAYSSLGSETKRIDQYQCDYIYATLATVMRKRGNPIDHDNPAQRMKAVLDRVNGHDDRCSRCNVIHGVDLWNASNWGFLRGIMPPGSMGCLFIANLPLNAHEFQGLNETITSGRWFSYEVFMNEILAIDPEDPSSNLDMSTSYRDDWVCSLCVAELIRSRLHIWWLRRKMGLGLYVPTVDCWDGYDCLSGPEGHDKEFNHLCSPTQIFLAQRRLYAAEGLHTL